MMALLMYSLVTSKTSLTLALSPRERELQSFSLGEKGWDEGCFKLCQLCKLKPHHYANKKPRD
jgi:hypothetical protein